MINMKNIINLFYRFKALGAIFHTLDYCLQRELKDCESVLDLGCGPSSPLQYCRNIKYSIGVEVFTPYLEESKKRNIHTKYIDKKIEEIDFAENSFDAVMMIEVLEHLPENLGYEVLKKAEKWAKKKVIISSPNGFVPQKEVDNNLWQKHLSGWDYKKLKNLGFKVNGLAGLKCLRREVKNNIKENNLMNSIRFWPKPFWFIVAALSQLATFFIPQLAFGLFAVKKLKE